MNFILRIIFALTSISLLSCSSAAKKKKLIESQNLNQLELGKLLYFDSRVTAGGVHSCNACHQISNQGSGAGFDAFGGKIPTVWNAKIDWSKEVPHHELTTERIIDLPRYKELFKEDFTIEYMKASLTRFVDSLVAVNSRYDKYKAGDLAAMSVEEISGLQHFNKAGCVNCHSGLNFESQGVTQLRNISLRAPNLLETTRSMVNLKSNQKLNESQVTQIAAFLKALESELPQITEPKLP